MARKRRKSEPDPLMQDIVGIAAFTIGAVLFVGLVASRSGTIDRTLGVLLKSIVGLGAYAVPVLLMFVGIVLVLGSQRPTTRAKVAGFLLLFVAFVTWCQFANTPNILVLVANQEGLDPAVFKEKIEHGGGYLGLGLSYVLEWAVGRTNSHIILAALSVIGLLFVIGTPIAATAQALVEHMRFSPRRQVRGYDNGKTVDTPRRPEIGPDPKSRGKPEFLTILKERILSGKDEAEVQKGAVLVRSGSPTKASASNGMPMPRDSEFQLPPITLLKEPAPPLKRAQAELNYKIDKIEQTLEEFKIEADVVEVSHGPTVTRYEIQLAPGIKVNKIVSLADNLAMALAAIDVRVEAPIPGKSAIGVEVPNDNPAVVTLREVIDTDDFWHAPSKLTFALGKDVAGDPRLADLTKMPHMLVAGATNAGKSVCLNTLIASLLFRATPRELKLILIDPKRVELSLFDGIPHLCSPVVKDVRQAAGILRSTLKEMESRYDKFVKVGTRNFDGYNAKVKPEERLPYLVVIVDELADLMMQAGPEVEFCICRLAQLARATGIHLVIATQRPSVDVVTGLIKANISSRISFAVSSQIDSRTILDMGGAERLIGRGDMLFKPIDASKPTRIQGCLVTEKEIEELVKFLKEQEAPDYTMEPTQIGEGPTGDGGVDDALNDEWYEPAVRLVVTSGYASTSMLQRRFKIGYTRAARLVDAMEHQGIVGPLDGAKPREVLIAKADLDRLFGIPGFSSDMPDEFDEDEEM